MSFQLLYNRNNFQSQDISEIAQFQHLTDDIFEIQREEVACPLSCVAMSVFRF